MKGLGSTAERRMRGCPVSLNRLIIRMFWLKCKDERKRRNDRLGEDGSIFPYIKNIPSFLKKMVMFLRNITIFLENIKVFFAAWECVKTKPRPYEPKDSIVHVLTHPPVCKVCTYASGYTYVRMSLHVYMSLCQAVPNEYKVERFWCLPHKRMFKGFVFPRNITVDKISLAAKRSRCF